VEISDDSSDVEITPSPAPGQGAMKGQSPIAGEGSPKGTLFYGCRLLH
jgi:hypothetical protein